MVLPLCLGSETPTGLMLWNAQQLYFLCPCVDRYNAAGEAIETYIAPTNLFHDCFQCRCIGEAGEGMRQVVIFLKGLSNDCTKQWSKPVEVEVEKGTENFAGRMTDLQANYASSRAHHAQHFPEPLPNIGQVTYCESGTAAINAIIWQIDMLGIPKTQVNTVL